MDVGDQLTYEYRNWRGLVAKRVVSVSKIRADGTFLVNGAPGRFKRDRGSQDLRFVSCGFDPGTLLMPWDGKSQAEYDVETEAVKAEIAAEEAAVVAERRIRCEEAVAANVGRFEPLHLIDALYTVELKNHGGQLYRALFSTNTEDPDAGHVYLRYVVMRRSTFDFTYFDDEVEVEGQTIEEALHQLAYKEW